MIAANVLRVILYEGEGSRALEDDRRYELMRTLLEKGYAVTSTRSGGFKYRPTTSWSFSRNCLSRLSLNVLVRWGLSWCWCQIRRTVAALTPCAFAIVRVVQCVALAGLVCSVASTIAFTCGSAIRGSRPGRGASFSKPANRRLRKRSRQSCTVGRETPRTRAIS